MVLYSLTHGKNGGPHPEEGRTNFILVLSWSFCTFPSLPSINHNSHDTNLCLPIWRFSTTNSHKGEVTPLQSTSLCQSLVWVVLCLVCFFWAVSWTVDSLYFMEREILGCIYGAGNFEQDEEIYLICPWERLLYAFSMPTKKIRIVCKTLNLMGLLALTIVCNMLSLFYG